MAGKPRDAASFRDLVCAHVPVFCLGTVEVHRATKMLAALGAEMDCPVNVYSPGQGLREGDGEWKSLDPVELLREIVQRHVRAPLLGVHTLWVLQLFHPYLEDPDPLILSALRTLHDEVRFNTSVILLVKPGFALPAELADVPVLRLPPPDAERLRALLATDLEAYSPEETGALADALRGATEREAENLLSVSLLRRGRFDAAEVRVLREALLREREGRFLDVSRPEEGLEDVGGMNGLASWLEPRRAAFLAQGGAGARRLPPPRGVLLFGVPGCGKTLAARAVAGSWRVPLVQMAPGRLYTAEVGGSERRMQQALDAACAAAPCVLLIDEIEKAFAPTSGLSDGGVSLRIQAALLDFLQGQRQGVFVVATSNGIHGMLPELLRRGRWDDLFFVDLPDEREREHILRVLLRRYGILEPVDAAWVKGSEGFSGAELEQCVRDTLYGTCAQAEQPFSPLGLLRQLRQMVPLSRLRETEIRALRDWASQRARLANGGPPAG